MMESSRTEVRVKEEGAVGGLVPVWSKESHWGQEEEPEEVGELAVVEEEDDDDDELDEPPPPRKKVVDPDLVAEYLPINDDDYSEDDGTDLDPKTAKIPIRPLPRPRKPLENDDGVKYLGFLPHSGFHNQRMALQNALLLGSILNRTVLVPPVWIGWPTPTEVYDELQKSWTDILLTSPHSFNLVPPPPSSPLNSRGHYPSSSIDYPIFNGTAIEASRVETLKHTFEVSKAKWGAKGFEVRPDGFPITNLTAKDCKSYSAECRHTYKDTFLAWDFLVDLDKVLSHVQVIDRWDIRERAIEPLLSVSPSDVYVLRDGQIYDFQFVHTGKPSSALIVPSLTHSHWARRVQLPALSSLPHKVLLVGSLFGSGRIHAPSPGGPLFTADRALRSFFSRSMAFRNPVLVGPANEMRDRMGGRRGYVGVHARVGDGVFMWRARSNMERAWRRTVRSLGVEGEVAEGMWREVGWGEEEEKVVGGKDGWKKHAKRGRKEERRSEWAHLDGEDEDDDTPDADATADSDEPHHHHHPRRSPLLLPSLKSLSCRSPLHTTPSLLPFNTPLYLATDSRTPTTDPVLAPFFAAFPCTFILSDFDRPSDLNGGMVVESVGRMLRLENRLDGVPLGRLLLPFLEATVAAKGFETVGTFASTFSAFAAGDLHAAYREDEVPMDE